MGMRSAGISSAVATVATRATSSPRSASTSHKVARSASTASAMREQADCSS